MKTGQIQGISMVHAEELLDIGAEGFLVTISMVKDDGQFELQDLPTTAEYEDVFVALGRVTSRHKGLF